MQKYLVTYDLGYCCDIWSGDKEVEVSACSEAEARDIIERRTGHVVVRCREK